MTTFLDPIEREVLREVTPKIQPLSWRGGGAFPGSPSPGGSGWRRQNIAGVLESGKLGSGS